MSARSNITARVKKDSPVHVYEERRFIMKPEGVAIVAGDLRALNRAVLAMDDYLVAEVEGRELNPEQLERVIEAIRFARTGLQHALTWYTEEVTETKTSAATETPH
jgi:hypothetical protein